MLLQELLVVLFCHLAVVLVETGPGILLSGRCAPVLRAARGFEQ